MSTKKKRSLVYYAFSREQMADTITGLEFKLHAAQTLADQEISRLQKCVQDWGTQVDLNIKDRHKVYDEACLWKRKYLDQAKGIKLNDKTADELLNTIKDNGSLRFETIKLQARINRLQAIVTAFIEGKI